MAAKVKSKRRVEGLRFDFTTDDVQDRMGKYVQWLGECQTIMQTRRDRMKAKPVEDIEAEMRAAHDIDQFAPLPHDPEIWKKEAVEALEHEIKILAREAEEVTWLSKRTRPGSVFNVSFEDFEWLMPGMVIGAGIPPEV